MIKVGITGGIGAGKSTISDVFKILGVPVYDADTRAKFLMGNNDDLKEGIKSRFGNDIYDGQGQLIRANLASKVFNDPIQLNQLNELVHPVVRQDFNSWCGQTVAPYVLKEAALLIETGSYQDLDFLILVTAPKKLRMERVLMRDEFRDKLQVEKIIENQLPEGEKKKYADFLINNDESHPILQQVLEIHTLLTHKALNFS